MIGSSADHRILRLSLVTLKSEFFAPLGLRFRPESPNLAEDLLRRLFSGFARGWPGGPAFLSCV